MPDGSLSIEQIITLLTETPHRIDALTARLLPAQLHTAPDQGEWAANDILAHLRACADVWGNCIAEIVQHDKPTLRAINPRTWIQSTNYPQEKFRASLRAFTAQRANLLSILKPLPLEAWARTAKVTGAGKPLERTVLFYAEWLVSHERTHLKQIERMVTRRKAP